MNDHDYWASSSEFEVEWVDMDLMPCLAYDDWNWFMDEMDNKVCMMGLPLDNMDSISYGKTLIT
ncbi:hypothetical protein TanjilG_02244 [Lupinus angustifolius]|uniref:Uncharacterized protein n=1 Tax=Lupinus angustifolius TaxID=3871 RepID=A0A4P1QQF4_LUPAN|nr:hypothetical protein TanjilG_02244 [Lupinus angustifolius]